MMEVAINKDKFIKLKIIIDVLSVLSVIYLCAIFPIWLSFDLIFYGHLGKTSTQLWAMYAGIIPSIFGLQWLAPRYKDTFIKKFPSPYMQIALTLACGIGVPTALLFIFIIKTLWTS